MIRQKHTYVFLFLTKLQILIYTKADFLMIEKR